MQPSNIPLDSSSITLAIEAATAVRNHAYAPYSSFQVGACVLDSQGMQYVGCNVENASYGLTMCAERAAVAAAVANGHRDITLCVIVTNAEKPTAPCGACRQVLFECNPEMEVVARTLQGHEQRWILRDLLPSAFGSDSLPEST